MQGGRSTTGEPAEPSGRSADEEHPGVRRPGDRLALSLVVGAVGGGAVLRDVHVVAGGDLEHVGLERPEELGVVMQVPSMRLTRSGRSPANLPFVRRTQRMAAIARANTSIYSGPSA